jgi:hypothetical protein
MSVWTPTPPCANPWTGGTKCQDGNFKPVTVCRRPYGRQAYGRGPYGRCAVLGNYDWAPTGQGPLDTVWGPQ